LIDALGLRQAGVAGHDVGGGLMQPLALAAPERIAGLFFFDFLCSGIGPRISEPDRLISIIWYSRSTIHFARKRFRLQWKMVGPPDAIKHWRPRAASLKFRPGSAASPASGATKRR
jgi:pimeloyl-ACP methyl ester carboxylesterase